MNWPPHITAYRGALESASTATEVEVDLIAAIIDRESRFGLALKPVGPTGTGDWMPRAISHKYFLGNPRFRPAVLQKRIDGELVRVPAVIPADGLGWGRGLGQKDYASGDPWVDQFEPDGITFTWQVPEKAILKCAEDIQALWETFGGQEFRTAMTVAGYNAGADRVREVVDALTRPLSADAVVAALDAITTEDYVSWVLRRRRELQPS